MRPPSCPNAPAIAWALSAVCLVLQDDEEQQQAAAVCTGVLGATKICWVQGN